MRFLVLTKEKGLASKLKECLNPEYLLDFLDCGAEGVYAVQSMEYKIMFIHDSIPDIRASSLCQQVRRKGVNTPIIILSSSASSSPRVACLERGADDFLPLPFDPQELRARIKALLRRATPEVPMDNIYEVGGLHIDFWSRTLIVNDQVIHLRKREFDLLEYLVINRNRALSRDMVLSAIWPEGKYGVSNVVDVSICNLRKKLRELIGVDPIKTIYGTGYSFDDSQLLNDS